MGTLLMSMSERRRLAVFAQVSSKQISVAKAGRVLGICERQARRIWKQYQARGDAGLVHGLRGKPSNASDPDRRRRVLARYRQRYLEFGAAHAAEHLERDKLPVVRSTLWYWLDQEELVIKRRRAAKHRTRRERRACVGELVQMDGSTHDWFSGRGPMCVLFVMVDDATGKTFCRFYESEDTIAAFDLFGRYVKKHGLPQGLYVDKDSIYRVNDPKAREAGALAGKMPLTQFGRAMKQLEVKIICAGSPQAKGRVERMNGTLQDRLVKELTLQKIGSIPAANAFLEKTFLRQFNAVFTRTPAGGTNLHRPVPHGVVLAQVLCVIEQRTVGLDWCVQYGGRILQIHKKHEGLALARHRVEVTEGSTGSLELRYRGQTLQWHELPARPMSVPLPQIKPSPKPAWRPGTNHPWNRAARQARSAAVGLAALAQPPLRGLDGPGG
jgi:hypothetical protein